MLSVGALPQSTPLHPPQRWTSPNFGQSPDPPVVRAVGLTGPVMLSLLRQVHHDAIASHRNSSQVKALSEAQQLRWTQFLEAEEKRIPAGDPRGGCVIPTLVTALVAGPSLYALGLLANAYASAEMNRRGIPPAQVSELAQSQALQMASVLCSIPLLIPAAWFHLRNVFPRPGRATAPPIVREALDTLQRSAPGLKQSGAPRRYCLGVQDALGELARSTNTRPDRENAKNAIEGCLSQLLTAFTERHTGR